MTKKKDKKKRKVKIDSEPLNFDATYTSLRNVFDKVDIQKDIGIHEFRLAMEDINKLSSLLMDYAAAVIFQDKNK